MPGILKTRPDSSRRRRIAITAQGTALGREGNRGGSLKGCAKYSFASFGRSSPSFPALSLPLGALKIGRSKPLSGGRLQPDLRGKDIGAASGSAASFSTGVRLPRPVFATTPIYSDRLPVSPAANSNPIDPSLPLWHPRRDRAKLLRYRF